MKKILVFILVLMMVFPVQAFAYSSPEEPSKKIGDINGMFEISVKTESKWINAGNLEFGKFQETKEIDLCEYLNGDNPPIKITQKGGGAAYLDAVLLDYAAPVKANNSEGKILNKLAAEDLDITPVDAGIILEFSSKSGEGILSVTGRIENEVISQEPLQFPIANNYKQKNQIADFYNYTLNSNIGKITVDSVLDEVENMGTFAKEYQVPGSGHPAGDTYFWVMNDDENLYVTIDFTPDNTYDGDKDYAKVYVNSDEGIKEFKVSVPETKWGSAGFTYTDKVVYEHKVYEFIIPFSEIGNTADELELAFVVYGTAALPMIYCMEPDLAYDPINKLYLSVYQRGEKSGGDWYHNMKIYGSLVDADGNETYEFLISDGEENTAPSVAYDSNNQTFLVVWSSRLETSESYEYRIDGRTVTVEPDNSVILGNEFTIKSTTDGDVNAPHLAFDSNAEMFLVVWENYAQIDSGDGYIENRSIDGQFVKLIESGDEFNSQLVGSALSISDTDYIKELNPSVCYDYYHDCFLAVWERNDEVTSIRARVIKSTAPFMPSGEIGVHVENFVDTPELPHPAAPEADVYYSPSLRSQILKPLIMRNTPKYSTEQFVRNPSPSSI